MMAWQPFLGGSKDKAACPGHRIFCARAVTMAGEVRSLGKDLLQCRRRRASSHALGHGPNTEADDAVHCMTAVGTG